jgi:hypothetical protein
MDTLKRVQDTWDELEYRIRPLRYWVFVRTEGIPQKTESGLIWLPTKLTGFFGELPHMQLVKAVICAVGPQAAKNLGLKVGERVIFKRLEFAWRCKLADGTYFGWINANHIHGYPEDDEEQVKRQAGDVQPPRPDEVKTSPSEYSM